MQVEMNLSESFKEFEESKFNGLLKLEDLPDISIVGDGENVIISGKTYDFVNLFRMLDGKFKEYQVSFIEEDSSTIEKTVKGWMINSSKMSIVDNNLQDVIKASKIKKQKWGVACEKAGVKFATKGSVDYVKVMEIFKNLSNADVVAYLKKKEDSDIAKHQGKYSEAINAKNGWYIAFKLEKGREPTPEEKRDFEMWCSVNILGHE